MIHIVDDDQAVRKSLVRLMRSAGYTARAFASAEEYLRDVHDAGTAAPACLILDLHLPGMSGPDMQDVIKQREPPAPVIILTATYDPALCARAVAAGAATVLRKPCHSTVLLGAIAEAIQRSSPPALPRPASLAADPTTPPGESGGGETGSEDPENLN